MLRSPRRGSVYCSQTGMELRVLHTAAYESTWYGRWGYAFGRGGYNLQPANWDAAAEQLHSAPLADVLHDFRDIDRAIVAIVRRYRVRICVAGCGPHDRGRRSYAASGSWVGFG